MWLITNFGFFSIVEKSADRGHDTLTVRARFDGDLEMLRERYLPQLGPTLENAGTDYKFRAQAPRAAIAAAIAQAVADIDYTNLKSSVMREQGYARADVYGGIWRLLYEAQTRESRQPELSAD